MTQTIRPTPPPLAGRGGHDDNPVTVHAPHNRAEESQSPQERLRRAEGEARAATAAAEAAEAEAARNRVAAKEAAQVVKRHERDLERQEQEWRAQTGRQVQMLEDQLRRLTSARVAAPAVGPIDRAHARTYLHGLSAGPDAGLTAIAHLRQADEYLAQLLVIHQAAGSGLGIAHHHAGDEILAKLDRLECLAWRQIVARCQVIAGEVDA